jgi:hypothetical protein
VLFSILLVETARRHSGEPFFWLSGLYFNLFGAIESSGR